MKIYKLTVKKREASKTTYHSAENINKACNIVGSLTPEELKGAVSIDLAEMEEPNAGECAILSESSLKKVWLTPEEDAWSNL